MSKRPVIRPDGTTPPVQSFLNRVNTVGEMPPVRSATERKREVDRKTVEEAREEGRQLGYREGVTAGYEMGKLQGMTEGHADAVARHEERVAGEIEAFRVGLMEAVESVFAARRAMLAELETVLGGLAVDVASRVVAKQVEVDPAVAVAIAREALREVTHATMARVRVNPFGSEAVRARADELMALSQTLRGVEIVDDPSLDGGCVVETDGGVIDARIAARLANLVEAARPGEAA